MKKIIVTGLFLAVIGSAAVAEASYFSGYCGTTFDWSDTLSCLKAYGAPDCVKPRCSPIAATRSRGDGRRPCLDDLSQCPTTPPPPPTPALGAYSPSKGAGQGAMPAQTTYGASLTASQQPTTAAPTPSTAPQTGNCCSNDTRPLGACEMKKCIQLDIDSGRFECQISVAPNCENTVSQTTATTTTSPVSPTVSPSPTSPTSPPPSGDCCGDRKPDPCEELKCVETTELSVSGNAPTHVCQSTHIEGCCATTDCCGNSEPEEPCQELKCVYLTTDPASRPVCQPSTIPGCSPDRREP